jgi:hypothetical protein|tara:strand:- start:31 stop:429 length:399 start_codon:yes stop_codon:yes gene_type:complete
MNKNGKAQGTLIGSITADIDGDRRYTSKVTVTVSDTRTQAGHPVVIVQRLQNGARGGMDGPGGAYDMAVRTSTELVDPSPRRLVEAIKDKFDDTIRIYGKPTKRFEWFRDGNYRASITGLSAAKAKAALNFV